MYSAVFWIRNRTCRIRNLDPEFENSGSGSNNISRNFQIFCILIQNLNTLYIYLGLELETKGPFPVPCSRYLELANLPVPSSVYRSRNPRKRCVEFLQFSRPSRVECSTTYTEDVAKMGQFSAEGGRMRCFLVCYSLVLL